MSHDAGPVVVLMGGTSNEREVSLKTGRALLDALREAGVAAEGLDLTPETVTTLIEMSPRAAMIALHGVGGEDGTVQGLLEFLGIPYTGSGVLASALAIDKVRSKRMFEQGGVPTPRWTVVAGDATTLPAGWDVPVVIKPSLEGSSVGVELVRDASEVASAIARCATHPGAVLVETLVEGRELTVGIFDDDVLGVVEVTAAEGWYDYQAKYERGDTRYLVPAPLSDEYEVAVVRAARAAYDMLGCRGVARVDVMLSSSDGPQVLEVNTVPGMTGTSLVPKLAAARGMAFPAFAAAMIASATTDAGARGAR